MKQQHGIRGVFFGLIGFWAGLAFTGSQPKYTLAPATPTALHVPAFGDAVVEYQVTNQTNMTRTLTTIPVYGITQNVVSGTCSRPFTLAPKASCLLSLLVDRAQVATLSGPVVCATAASDDPRPEVFSCSQPSQAHALTTKTLSEREISSAFPYGAAPSGDVCVPANFYATPESLLGSWAMIQAVAMDSGSGALPSLFTSANTVYAVGTAALGDQLGIQNCSGGCNQLNGYCFAIKFLDKTANYPYMIFQSVNIAANPNSFDIYMAGGGSGAFPDSCKAFWGTGTSVDWGQNIENAAPPACETYFNHFSTIQSAYSVTYNGATHDAKDTLMNACAFASQTEFNTQNWGQLQVVPVTCPNTLTQISGVELPSDITKVGTQTIYPLSSFQERYFTESTITGVTTTQMQDCKTPSSGYCGNVPQSVPNYQASISADLTQPLLKGPPSPSTNYCTQNPTFSGGFCSWSQGQSTGGGYCNQSQSICIGCGNQAEWCSCNAGTLSGCTSQP